MPAAALPKPLEAAAASVEEPVGALEIVAVPVLADAELLARPVAFSEPEGAVVPASVEAAVALEPDGCQYF